MCSQIAKKNCETEIVQGVKNQKYFYDFNCSLHSQIYVYHTTI